MRRVALTLLLLALLGACRQDKAAAEWPVGRWAVDGQSCQEAWLTYTSDGIWTDRFTKGTWTVEGRRLTLAITGYRTRQGAPAWKPVPTLCHSEVVKRLSAGEFRSVWEDGSVHRSVECPAASAQSPDRACVGDCARVTPFDQGGWNEEPPAAVRTCPK